jgi:hypothetical protein
MCVGLDRFMILPRKDSSRNGWCRAIVPLATIVSDTAPDCHGAGVPRNDEQVGWSLLKGLFVMVGRGWATATKQGCLRGAVAPLFLLLFPLPLTKGKGLGDRVTLKPQRPFSEEYFWRNDCSICIAT